ncbi:MAG: response regulator [Desulfamplus sp.]|nr:response regulator [Desulfamplus sp.]
MVNTISNIDNIFSMDNGVEKAEKSNIVLIDDLPANLRLLTGILANPNYIIRAMSDPLVALSSIKTDPPDIILLDIMMPTMSGYDLCSCLKADPSTKDIPIIFITARDNIEDKVKGFSLGAVDYITKPFLSDDVIARVQIHLKMYSLQKNLQRRTEVIESLNRQLESENRQRRQVEETLRETSLWLTSVFNALEEAVIILNPDRVIMDVNPAAEKIFGYTRNEMRKQSCEMIHVDLAHYIEFRNKASQAFERGEAASFEYRVKRKDGTIFSSEHSISMLKTATQKTIGMVSVVRDLTEKKQAEEKFLESERLKTVLEIAGTVCHELNQPLMSISGYTELAMMDISSNKINNNNSVYVKLQKIMQQIERMAGITKRLMRISRYETKDYPDCKIVDLIKSSEDKH